MKGPNSTAGFLGGRRIAFVLIGVSVLLYAFVALPRGRESLTAADEYARLRRGRLKTRAEMDVMERRIDAMARAAGLAQGSTPLSLTAVRRAVLAALEGEPLSGVRLQISRDSRGQGARIHLSAQGRYLDLARLPGRLASRGTGLVLERVVLAAQAQGAGLEMDGLFFGGGA
jgi:hypothetical protein